MAWHNITLPLLGTEADGLAAAVAARTAAFFKARLVGCFTQPRPEDSAVAVADHLTVGYVASFLETARETRQRQEDVAARHFWRAADEAGLARSEGGVKAAGAVWQDVQDWPEAAVLRAARRSDVVVFPRVGDDTRRGLLEDVLLNGGCAVLYAAAPVRRWNGTAAFAWNGSAESARAFKAALPALRAAARVHLLVAEDEHLLVEAPEMLAYMALHGIEAEQRFLPRQGAAGTGALIREAATGLDADLLVMGGYGRSRLREIVLGGATRELLADCGLPLLLAH